MKLSEPTVTSTANESPNTDTHAVANDDELLGGDAEERSDVVHAVGLLRVVADDAHLP